MLRGHTDRRSFDALSLRRRPSQPGRSRGGAIVAIAGAAMALVGGSALVSPLRVAAQAPTPVAAEGDSYALGGYVTVLGGDRVAVGPVAPSNATAPVPLNPDGLNVSTFACNGASCVTPLVNSVSVTADTAKAFVPGLAGAPVSVAATDCNPYATVLPGGFVTGPLTGGNACSNIAHVEIGGATGIVADAVSVQSLTQSCTATPVGAASYADLFLGGSEIGPLNNNTITPNTVIAIPSVATVILNEQIAENKSAPGPGGTTQDGHGMTVNAIHVIVPTSSILAGLAGADIIIGHAHSDAICGSAVTPLCTPGSSLAICQGVTITKLPEDLNVVDGQFVAAPGDTFRYSISIANVANCPVTQVIDTLPVGFTFVSASGPLGTPVTGTAQNGAQTLTWFKGSGWATPNPLVETITVKIAANEPAGAYVNQVQVLDDCDQNSASSPPVYVQPGNQPTPTPTPSASATPSASPSAAPSATPTNGVQSLINPPTTGGDPTSFDLPVPGAIALVMAGLGGVAGGFVSGRRRRRRARTD
jgi:uncharacterized repeat protein (TIGR01451 family)